MADNDLIQVGTVCETQSGKALVKVNVLGRVTPWLPVLMQANSYKRTYVPMKTGEQVVVLASRYVVGSIFNVDCKEPSGASESVEVTEFSDSTRILYDVDEKKLTIDAANEINVTCTKATVTATDTIHATANTIHLNGGKGSQTAVRQCDLCAFTGKPHPMSSGTVFIGD